MALSEICRLCLEHRMDFLDIFLHEEGSFKINELLSYYSLIELTPDDEISNKICTICWSKIHDFHEFCIRIQTIQESISSIIYVDTRSDANEIVLSNADDCDLDVSVKIEEIKGDFTDTEDNHISHPVEEVMSVDDDAEKLAIAHEDESFPQNDVPLNDVKTTSKRRTVTRKIQGKPTEKDESNEKLINSFFDFNCQLCNESFKYCAKLFNHYEVEHKIRGFIICCEKKFFRIPKIAEHVLRHKNPELFKCTKCDIENIFPDKRQLEAHMVTHMDADSNVFQCQECDKTFVKKYRYDQHKLIHLSPEEKKYICQDCGKPYATETLLRVHVRAVHMKSYAHRCEICDKVFKSRVFFEKHQLEHMGKTLPRVQCQICNTWMKNEHTMRAHRRLHDDEGAVHECELCGKIGPSRNSILKHKRYVHFSERKFKCTLCTKAFKRPVGLKEHMTLHTGETLYKCTFCTKTFNSGANMFAHKKKMHHSEWKTEKEQNDNKRE